MQQQIQQQAELAPSKRGMVGWIWDAQPWKGKGAAAGERCLAARHRTCSNECTTSVSWRPRVSREGCSGRLLPALLVIIPENEILRLASHARQRCGVWGRQGSQVCACVCVCRLPACSHEGQHAAGLVVQYPQDRAPADALHN